MEYKTREFTYNFSLYLRGPYSPDLAKDYYGIKEDEIERYPDLVLSKEAIDITMILNSKDNLWLEIASTVILMYSGWKEWKSAVNRTKNSKWMFLKSMKKAMNT
ncbi:MAG: hypothetical protein ACP5MW_05290 [Thermoplasmata archaeon]